MSETDPDTVLLRVAWLKSEYLILTVTGLCGHFYINTR
ncbi:unnamed protein product [Ciceribacter sp. T2.26MG-112.2]|nr:unnamed protein product [Ciceribacter naphthalenivorans]